MLLWLLFAVMTGLAVLSVLVPLSRARRGEASPAAHDVAVYRDQLEEVERDLDRGVMSASDAAAARIEISRRLLAAARAETPTEPGGTRRRRRIAASVALVLIPALALGIYLVIGSPDLPALPFASRRNVPLEQQSIGALIQRIEWHLADAPQDVQGWDVVAPVYVRLGRAEDAVLAYRTAIRLGGATVDREAGLGEALVAAAGGIVTADARTAFEAALKIEPTSARARFSLALAAAQDGKVDEAVAALKAILADSPPDAPWRRLVTAELGRLTRQGITPPTAPPAVEPSEDAARELAALPPAERERMIRGMVERLAERLKANGDNPEDWVRLVRSYVVLGDRDKAREAMRAAREALKANATGLALVEALTQELGLGS